MSNTLADYEALDDISSLHSPHDSIAWKDQNRKAEMAKEINMGKFSPSSKRKSTSESVVTVQVQLTRDSWESMRFMRES